MPAAVLLAMLLAALVLTAACGRTANPPAGEPKGSTEQNGSDGSDFADRDAPTPPMVLKPPKPAPDFSLTDQKGKEFRLSDQRGQMAIIFFGYTTCPDICPATLAKLRTVKQELGTAADAIQFIFISVDPARDTSAKLATMLSRFGDEDFIGLTGDAGVLADVWRDYNVYVGQVPDEDAGAGHYWVEHSSLLYLVEDDGLMTLVYTHNFDPGRMAADIRQRVTAAND